MVTVPDNSPILADSAGVLSGQLRSHLRRLGAVLAPEAGSLQGRFERKLRRWKLEGRAQQALSAITPGAMAKVLADGRGTGSLFEQVEYHGRRLAKLNVAPSLVVEALQEYDRLLAPVLKKLAPSECANFGWVRDQLQFCVVLTLNNAYYQVRETETEAFYALSRVELESRNLGELLGRFLETLTPFCRADAASLYWLEDGDSQWKLAAGVGAVAVRCTEESRRLLKAPRCWSWSNRRAAERIGLLDGRWAEAYRSCWSVPLLAGGRLVGAMQFGFKKTYEWLPREVELLVGAAERCQMSAEKVRLMEDLAQREEQIRTLAERMLHVEEAERRRISRELHDEAGQSLLCVRLQLEMVEQALPVEAEGIRVRLGAARAETEKTILEIRRLLAALSPAVLEQLGLAAALRQLITRFRQVHPAKVQLQLLRLQGLPKQMESIVYRLVQECCNNAAKHSRANTVKLSASTADQVFRLLVEDDGVGFDVQAALEKNNSYGLSGIRERVTLMGGRFSIESWPGQGAANTATASRAEKARRGSGAGKSRRGTRIVIELPIPAQQHQARSRNLRNVG